MRLKLTISFWSIFVLSIMLLLPGCMSVTGSQNAIQPTNTTIFNNKKIAILPAKMQASLAPDSVMALRVEVNKRLAPVLRTKIPSAIITDIVDVADRLNQTNTLANFEQLISSYEATGIMDKRQANALGQALGCDFFLVSRIKSEKLDIGFLSKGAGASLDVMLVNANSGQVDWAGSGEWKKGGMFGQGGAGFDELAENIVTPAFESLQSSGGTAQAATSTTKVPENNGPQVATKEDSPKKKASPNQELARVQQKLIDLGYDPGQPDGLSGKKTRNALKKFQQDNGLSVTGKADKQTIDKLLQSPGTAQGASTNPPQPSGSTEPSLPAETLSTSQENTAPDPVAGQDNPAPPPTEETPQGVETPAVASPTDL